MEQSLISVARETDLIYQQNLIAWEMEITALNPFRLICECHQTVGTVGTVGSDR